MQTQAQLAPCQQTFYPLSDHLGSVNTLTDKDGNVALTQHFLPFGEDFESPKSTVNTCNNEEPWPYGFTGQYHDQESGLIYFHSRFYNPAIGHFMSADSVVPNPSDTYSYDRYAYVCNNPINLTDPTGHFTVLVAMLIAAAITATATFAATIISGGSTGRAFESAMIAGGSVFLFGPVAGAIVSAGIQASMHGGNVLQAMLIAGVSMGIGMGMGNAVGAAAQGMSAGAQGFLQVLASATVGGAISSAMGGDFWRGFISAGVAAGIRLAANSIVGAIEGNQIETDESTGSGPRVDVKLANTEKGTWQAEDDILNHPNVRPKLLADIARAKESNKEFSAIIYKDENGKIQYYSKEGTYDWSQPPAGLVIYKGGIVKSDVVGYLHYHGVKVGDPIPGFTDANGNPITAANRPSQKDATEYRFYHGNSQVPGARMYTFLRGGEIFRFNPGWSGGDTPSFQSIRTVHAYMK